MESGSSLGLVNAQRGHLGPPAQHLCQKSPLSRWGSQGSQPQTSATVALPLTSAWGRHLPQDFQIWARKMSEDNLSLGWEIKPRYGRWPCFPACGAGGWVYGERLTVKAKSEVEGSPSGPWPSLAWLLSLPARVCLCCLQPKEPSRGGPTTSRRVSARWQERVLPKQLQVFAQNPSTSSVSRSVLAQNLPTPPTLAAVNINL